MIEEEYAPEPLLRAVKNLPEHMQIGVLEYVLNGIPPGGFLYRVLRNDLLGAFQKADMINAVNMMHYALLLEVAPLGCWGTEEEIEQWQKDGGLKGRLEQENST